MGVEREGLTALLVDHLLVFGDDALPVGGGECRIFRDAGVDLGGFDDLFEAMMVDAEHDGAVHLDEAAVAVPGEAGVAAGGFEAADGVVVEAEVEDRVHHAGHGDAGAGADGDEKGLLLVAELEADGLLDGGEGGLDLFPEVRRIVAVIVVEGGADFGGDGKARGNGQANGGHFGEVRAFPAEQIAHIGAALVMAGAEAVNPLGLHV